jgi:hypothetical protein
MLDKKLQSYYENRFSMMSTDGWQDLMEDAQQMFNSLNHVLSIQNETDLMVKKGQLDLLQWLLNLKPASEQAYASLQEDSSGEAQDA